MLDALIITETKHAIAIELMRPVSTRGRVVIDITTPPHTLQYVERVIAPGDTVLDTPFSSDKCEVAASGQGNWFLPRVGAVSLAKLSLGAPATACINASAPFIEVFVADAGASVRVDGATGTVERAAG